ncbi:hypothetical protein Ddc_23613 [Ditylenchus destructor]|nr:hypothetical protein Ddc_23613 [Ditylenchus destructor]
MESLWRDAKICIENASDDSGRIVAEEENDFSSAVSPNAFKITFNPYWGEELTEFRETNITSGEMLELKKGLPVECQNECNEKYTNYTLERSIL